MNKAILLGRISTEVKLDFLKSGSAATNFRVAVDRNMSKEKKEEAKSKGYPTADFIRCKSFGKTAEVIGNHFEKGKWILVEGSIQTGKYDKDGITHYTTDLMVERFEFVGDIGVKKEQKEESFAPFESSEFEQLDDSEDIPF